MSQNAYLTTKSDDKEDTEMGDILVNKIKLAKPAVSSTCRSYDDYMRKEFVDRMIEGPVKRGRVEAAAREIGSLALLHVGGSSIRRQRRYPIRSLKRI